jgi:DNA-binding transcriptional LysR family regulator
MDLELLRTFLEVNRTRHFGRSSEALHITQAAVSNRIKTLEQTLGVRLFDRNTREIHLTPEGSRLVRHAEKQIAAWRAARQDVALAGSDRQLALGGSLRLWDALLQPWLHALRRRFVNLAIIAESHTPELLTRRLIDGVLDVAVLLEPAQLDTLQIQEVGTIEVICVSTRAGLSVDKALGGGYIYVDWGLSHGLEHRRSFPDAPEAALRVSQAKMALDYMLDIGGTAYLPRRMVQAHLGTGILHEVEAAPPFERRAYATYPIRSARLEFVEECIQLIRSSS